MTDIPEQNTTIYPGEDLPKYVYAVVDAEENEITRVIWDGVTPFNYQAIWPGTHLVLIGPAPG